MSSRAIWSFEASFSVRYDAVAPNIDKVTLVAVAHEQIALEVRRRKVKTLRKIRRAVLDSVDRSVGVLVACSRCLDGSGEGKVCGAVIASNTKPSAGSSGGAALASVRLAAANAVPAAI